jgi:hypothetical protein
LRLSPSKPDADKEDQGGGWNHAPRREQPRAAAGSLGRQTQSPRQTLAREDPSVGIHRLQMQATIVTIAAARAAVEMAAHPPFVPGRDVAAKVGVYQATAPPVFTRPGNHLGDGHGFSPRRTNRSSKFLTRYSW